MKYLGTFETIKFKDLGVTYLKGILHTFANLNQPDSTLAYDYDIIEFKKGSDLITDIKSHFDLFSNRPITLELISNERFNEALKLWLFGTKLVSDFRMERYIDFFHHLLIDITGLKNIYIINDIELEDYTYDFGVGYEHFILESDNTLYLVFFSYSD